jgi:NO-binding membrane sensor protein with MHYT domain
MFALILIGLGIAALAYQGVSYTTREKVIDFGPLQVTSEKTHTLPPITGAIALGGGIVLLIFAGKGLNARPWLRGGSSPGASLCV